MCIRDRHNPTPRLKCSLHETPNRNAGSAHVYDYEPRPGGGGQRHRFGPGDTHVIAGLEDLPIHADATADHIDERLGASGNEMLKRRLLHREMCIRDRS